MNPSDQPNQVLQGTCVTPHPFFRDIEIEFLIHELKDPIATIESGLRNLLEKQDKFGSLTSKQENALKRTLRNTKKARAMLDDLLEIGRSESGHLTCSHFRPTKSVYQALKDALEITTGPLSDEIGKYQTEKDVHELLWQNGILVEISSRMQSTEVFQDEVKFRQIAGNLFKNALHHRRERVNILLDVAENNLLLAVTDDGPGVAPEHHDMIFRRYTQVAEWSVAARKGHGLGLAGAQILAHCLGGDIKIDSRKGQGATFRLTLPVSMAG